MNNNLSAACDNYSTYLKRILNPAAISFSEQVSENSVQLHDAFGINLFLAHAVDYLHAIRKSAGLNESRLAVVQMFDNTFGIKGSRFGTRKFELIDAVNNALKHIQLDNNRYGDLIEKYGPISFNCLIQDAGRILCILDGYSFDYSRVVLRPAIQALSGYDFEDRESVLEFALGNFIVEDYFLGSYLEDDPIDQMIAYCNPICNDCAEPESDCLCDTYLYDGEAGEFARDVNNTFNFDSIMSKISGAYRNNE